MGREICLHSASPVDTVEVMDERQVEALIRRKAEAIEDERMRQQLKGVCEALNKAIEEVDTYRTTLFASHREHIVRLSLEIAGRILAKEVTENNYEIEKIVLQALESAPSKGQLVIRLNPTDLEAFEKAVNEQKIVLAANVQWQADGSLELADCVIDTDQGMIEAMIETHLRHIGQALLNIDRTEQ